MSAIGWVVGGSATAARALLEALGTEGTLAARGQGLRVVQQAGGLEDRSGAREQ